MSRDIRSTRDSVLNAVSYIIICIAALPRMDNADFGKDRQLIRGMYNTLWTLTAVLVSEKDTDALAGLKSRYQALRNYFETDSFSYNEAIEICKEEFYHLSAALTDVIGSFRKEEDLAD